MVYLPTCTQHVIVCIIDLYNQLKLHMLLPNVLCFFFIFGAILLPSLGQTPKSEGKLLHILAFPSSNNYCTHNLPRYTSLQACLTAVHQMFRELLPWNDPINRHFCEGNRR